MYGMSQTIPDRSLIQEMTFMFWDKYYSTQDPTPHEGGQAEGEGEEEAEK